MTGIGHVNNELLRPDVCFVPTGNEEIEGIQGLKGIVEIDLKLTDPALAYKFVSYRVTIATRLPGARKCSTVDYLVTGTWSDGDAFTARRIINMGLTAANGASDMTRTPQFTSTNSVEHVLIVHAINERQQPPGTSGAPIEDK